jgi:hypothetical protein
MAFYFPWGANSLIFSKFGLGTILSLVTLSHHTSLPISSLELTPVIQAYLSVSCGSRQEAFL